MRTSSGLWWPSLPYKSCIRFSTASRDEEEMKPLASRMGFSCAFWLWREFWPRKGNFGPEKEYLAHLPPPSKNSHTKPPPPAFLAPRASPSPPPSRKKIRNTNQVKGSRNPEILKNQGSVNGGFQTVVRVWSEEQIQCNLCLTSIVPLLNLTVYRPLEERVLFP